MAVPGVPDGTEVQIASATDLADVLGRPLTDSEAERADRRLLRAQSLLALRVPNLLARVQLDPGDTDYLDPSVAAEVIAGIVARQWRNPDGVTSRQQTAGPFTRTLSFRDQDGPGDLIVTDADVSALVPDDGFTLAGTIRTATPTFLTDRDWCSPQG